MTDTRHVWAIAAFVVTWLMAPGIDREIDTTVRLLVAAFSTALIYVGMPGSSDGDEEPLD